MQLDSVFVDALGSRPNSSDSDSLMVSTAHDFYSLLMGRGDFVAEWIEYDDSSSAISKRLKPGVSATDLPKGVQVAARDFLEWHESSSLEQGILLKKPYSYQEITICWAYPEEEFRILSKLYEESHPIWDALLHSAQQVWNQSTVSSEVMYCLHIWSGIEELSNQKSHRGLREKTRHWKPDWRAAFLRLAWDFEQRSTAILRMPREELKESGHSPSDLAQETRDLRSLLQEYPWKSMALPIFRKILNDQTSRWRTSFMKDTVRLEMLCLDFDVFK